MRLSVVVAGAIFVSMLTIGVVYAAGSGMLTDEDQYKENYDGMKIKLISDMTGAENMALVGGDTVTATVILTKDDNPVSVKGVDIHFKIDDNDLASISGPSAVKTNEYGTASIKIMTNNTIGTVKVTAYVTGNEGIYQEETLDVVGWGTVSGFVTDKNKNGVPGAKVTLYYYKYNSETDEYENSGIVKCLENPMLSNDGTTAAMGTYTFERIPWGLYNVTAEKDGHNYFAIVNLTRGTFTANIALPDYIFKNPVSSQDTANIPEPSPVKMPSISPPAYLADGHGLISGMVCDKNRDGIPGANVTLWRCEPDDNGNFVNVDIFPMDNNPGLSNDGSSAAMGVYGFNNIPFGLYNVTAEKDGHMYFATANLTKSFYTVNIVIPDYCII